MSSQLEAPSFEGPPAQEFTTAGLLMDLADVRISLTLRDGTVIVGILRSYDEYGSFVIQDAIERIFHKGKFAEREIGVWIIRGETVALLGKIDPERDQKNEQLIASTWEKVDFGELEKLRDMDRKEFENMRTEQAEKGFMRGLIGSNTTSNPYRF